MLDHVPTELYIAGAWRPASGGGTLTVEDPATGEPLCEVADAQPQDALDALAAAAARQAEWAAHPPRERGEILRRAYEELTARGDELALLMTLEMGKALAESKAEIAYAAEFFRWFSEEAVRIHGRYMTNTTGKGRILTMRQPVGPCVFVTPWNFPMAMGTRKLAPALAAGCTVVVKPAQQTPLSMLALTQILEHAGLPGGVLNIDHRPSLRRRGRAAAARPPHPQALLHRLHRGRAHPHRTIRRARPTRLDGARRQRPLHRLRRRRPRRRRRRRPHRQDAQRRRGLHRRQPLPRAAPIAEEFAARLAERMAALKVGRGTEPDTDVGPLIDARQREKVAELVADARQRGARVLTGGEALSGPGYFFEPTVLQGVTADARLLEEEIFGPVAPIATFDSEDEALAAANRTEYGLVAYLYTRDLERAFRVAEGLETGMIGLNQGIVSNAAAPFGGVKESGFGREGGFEGIGEYLETKYVALSL